MTQLQTHSEAPLPYNVKLNFSGFSGGGLLTSLRGICHPNLEVSVVNNNPCGPVGTSFSELGPLFLEGKQAASRSYKKPGHKPYAHSGSMLVTGLHNIDRTGTYFSRKYFNSMKKLIGEMYLVMVAAPYHILKYWLKGQADYAKVYWSAVKWHYAE